MIFRSIATIFLTAYASATFAAPVEDVSSLIIEARRPTCRSGFIQSGHISWDVCVLDAQAKCGNRQYPSEQENWLWTTHRSEKKCWADYQCCIKDIFFKIPEDLGYASKDYVSTWLNNATFHATPAQCHSHNDYWRPVPLFSALSVGCIGIEADVWLRNGDLMVGHDQPSLSPNRTLKSLYLDPLEEILDDQNREVTERNATRRGVFSLQDDAQIILLIDVKTDAKETWPVVLRQLEPLREKHYLTSHNSSASIDTKKHLPAPLIVVGTGNLDMDTLVANHSDATTTFHDYHDAFFDAPLIDLPVANNTNETKYNTTNSVYASASFKQAIGSVRLGFSRTQREKLRSQVQAAKSLGLQPRYWDIPDWPLKYRDYIWTELRAEGVEILSVDNVNHAAGGVWYGSYFADAVAMTVISPATFLVMSVLFWRAVWYWRYM
ncbi:hypothetical protein CGLO_06677 [Colletotrichum gloeosporioides Cg-14]|uniref:Altered inheritance of mitochondria protein 6 n=1 Tax=Colletotrichum gloeosporioides (strain Cg-14) TaxID=1237896 RepID=T0KLL7_COLGC|nr:hypothetical protein CGLO_06677 [Colletotrichum gloeosporioides Cg-14]